MKQMQFSVQIQAPKEKVWRVLWNSETFKDWASLLDPGTYIEGELKEGNEIQFISAENGYGVTSFVAKLVPNELLLLKHKADTQNFGENNRDNQWTGTEESYSLVEKDGITELTGTFDIPPELEEYFSEAYPTAFNRIKELAEES